MARPWPPMGRGAAAVLERLHGEGRLRGTISMGGSGNASVAAAAMRRLPVGVPKVIVSTLAAGNTGPTSVAATSR